MYFSRFKVAAIHPWSLCIRTMSSCC